MINVCGSTFSMVSLYKFADVRVFHNFWDLVLPATSAFHVSKCNSVFAALVIPSRFLMSMSYFQCFMQIDLPFHKFLALRIRRWGTETPNHWWIHFGTIPIDFIWRKCNEFARVEPANQNCDPIHFQLDFVCCCVFRFQPSKEHAINGIFYCANGNAKRFGAVTGVHHK